MTLNTSRKRNDVDRDRGGLLVVNADDLGLDSDTTDAILRCFDGERITSASAMVWMSDSERAMARARDRGMPLRLHLNLTEPFHDHRAPKEVRERQAGLVTYFRRSPLTFWTYNPLVASQVELAIEDQLAAFRRLSGTAPNAFDGHEHVHTSPTVFLSRALRTIPATRPTFTFGPGERPWVNRTVRTMLNGILRRRFQSTKWFFSLRDESSSLSESHLASRLALAEDASVELMTHPQRPDEYALLMSAYWRSAISEAQLGTLDDLPRPGVRRSALTATRS